MVQSLPIFVQDMLKTEVDILESQTYYVRFGDWFACGTTIIAVALLFASEEGGMNSAPTFSYQRRVCFCNPSIAEPSVSKLESLPAKES
jgi:hypothetical protein